jgi:hypothetical protein
MADIAKDTFNKSLRQRKVVFQQKKPLLNYELNLAQDILKESIEELTRVSIGDNFSGESFKVVGGRSGFAEVVVKKGTYYQNGIPVYLNQDVIIGADVIGIDTPGPEGRTDIVYATWRLEQVNAPIDPLIGFVTTQEYRIDLKIMYESNAELPSLVPPDTSGDLAGLREEKIIFLPDVNEIKLEKGFFPDWLRIPGTRFVTNTILNSGNPYFTVVNSSADGKTLIVDDGVSPEELKDVRFIEYEPSKEIKKEFRAYRDNIILLATIKRPSGVYAISSSFIIDERPSSSNSFIVEGCEPSFVEDSLEISVNSGKFLSRNNLEFIEDTVTLFAQNDSLNYLFVSEDNGGLVEVDIEEPTDPHAMIAEIVCKNGRIVNFRDVRKFAPALYNGGGGSSNPSVGPNPNPDIVSKNVIFQNFKAFEDIGKYQTIALGSNGSVRRSANINLNTMPVVGIAPEYTGANQINTFITYGVVKNNNWNWSAGEYLFASNTFGDLMESSGLANLSEGSFIQRVGIAISSNEILFNPDKTIYQKNNSEIPLLVLRDNGNIEVIGQDDKINTDRLSSLASLALNPASQAIQILPGRYFADGNKDIIFGDLTTNAPIIVNMGPSGTLYRTSPIPLFHYNKAYFTLDSLGNLKMYEGVPRDVRNNVLDPIIPDNEIPLSLVTFQDNGSGEAGSILNINRVDVVDRRNWLNLGITENSAFKPHYKNETSYVIQKGEAWFNKKYVSLEENVTLSIPSSNTGTYFIYLDLDETIGSNLNKIANSSCLSASISIPDSLDQRRYVVLGSFQVSSGVIERNSFKSFDSKFWEYRDLPYIGEQIFNVDQNQTVFTIESQNFTFTDTDFLEVLVNGDLVFEGNGEDYTKNASNPFTVTFNYPVLTGAQVRIRKL